MDAEREKRFDVIDRMRKAFDDVPEEQLERDVAEVIERVREKQRKQAASPTPT